MTSPGTTTARSGIEQALRAARVELLREMDLARLSARFRPALVPQRVPRVRLMESTTNACRARIDAICQALTAIDEMLLDPPADAEAQLEALRKGLPEIRFERVS